MDWRLIDQSSIFTLPRFTTIVSWSLTKTKKSPFSASRSSLTDFGTVTWNFPVITDLPTTSKEERQQGSKEAWYMHYLSPNVLGRENLSFSLAVPYALTVGDG